MISAITLNDRSGSAVTLHGASTAKRRVAEATGLLGGGVAAPRVNQRVRPQAHGGINDTKYTDGRIITLSCEASSQVSLEDAYSEYRAMVAPMQDTLDYGAALLKWTEGSTGLTLQRSVKVMGEVDPSLHDGAAMLDFTAQFFAEDPRAFSQAQTTDTGTTLSSGSGGLTFPFVFPFTFLASAGGTVSSTNAGTKNTPPIFRLYGYAQNPQIVNLATQDRIVFGGSTATPTAEVANGNYLEIDVQNRTVTLNGDSTVSQRQLVNSSLTSWFELVPGVTNLQLVAANFDATCRLDVLHRDAY